MTTVRIQILDMVARDIISVDEAVRLLKAAGESTGRRMKTAAARFARAGNDAVFMPETAGLAGPDHFVNGNITLR